MHILPKPEFATAAPEFSADAAASIDVEAAWSSPSSPRRPGEELERHVDALLKVPFLRLRLPPEMRARYAEDTRMTARRLNFPWFLWIAALVMLGGLFDVVWLAPDVMMTSLMFRLVAAASFVMGAWLVRQDSMIGYEHLVAIGPCLLAILFTGITGLRSADPLLMSRYMDDAMLVTYTAITFVRIDLRYCIWLAVMALALMAAFIMASNIQPIAAKLQSIVFACCVMAGLLQGRHIQNLFMARLYLLHTRDSIRSSEISRRNERLSSMAYMDKLTGVPNRRYFDAICAGISDEGNEPLPLSLCMIDIDNFKRLNDTLGHAEGDRCLSRVAATIRDKLRGRGDILARYGGEEFVLLLRATELARAVDIAERVRAAVAALDPPHPESAVGRVTISVGVAALHSRSRAIDDLVNDADAAMYRAKAAGRNRVSL
jgi:diguanylate cyclase (GGDEF)-like protein